jgi:prepilin signal peptidase PulO-like enzyme (type II secretory pathway)
LIELSFGVGLVLLYVFEVNGGLLPIGAAPVASERLQLQFLGHAMLIALMIVATFIDLDEKTIPDEITLPGTLGAVLFAGVFPNSLMPCWRPGVPPLVIDRLLLTSPGEWSPWLTEKNGLWLALACIAGWWYAVLPKTLWYRGGSVKFVRYLVASIARNWLSWWLTGLALLAIAGTAWCWRIGGDHWQAVLTAWVGVAVGGGVVWLVRVVGTVALGQEAMGFGDVTLLGMIGAFLGWQTALMVFFLAPFAGVLLAVSQWLLTRRKDIAFGPFLCMATLIILLTWPVAWKDWGYPVFVLGWLVPMIFGGSLVLMGLVLAVLALARR